MPPFAALLAAALVAGQTPADLLGVWGGDGAVLTVTAAGARLETDCAAGSLPGPIQLDGNGRFSVPGVFQRGAPGPQRPVEEETVPPPPAVRYTGQMTGQVLVLKLEGGVHREFRLERGARPKLVRCL